MPARRRLHSLRVRWLAATLAAMAVALGLAGLLLHSLFQDHVRRQFQTTLVQQLDQLTGRLEFDASGQASIDPATLTDPRWSQPYSGLYWQLDEVGAASETLGEQRSRSLWDDRLHPIQDAPADGQVHVHPGTGPRQTALLRAAAAAGCATVDGLGMLVQQAALQQQLWHGQMPDAAVMAEAAERELAARRQ